VKQRGARSAGNPLAALRRGGDWNGAVEIPAGAPVFDPYTFVGDCPWLGTLDRWFLAGMTHDSVNPAAKTIPEALFMLYQMTFAIITVALVALSVADSMRLCAYLVFSVGWFIFAYVRLAHGIWGDRFLASMGVLDCAGASSCTSSPASWLRNDRTPSRLWHGKPVAGDHRHASCGLCGQ
jgi:hypothetical protein